MTLVNWGKFLVPAAARDYAVVAHEHPTKEDLFDLDWEQVDERYDPRLLSEDLINESQSDSDHKDDSSRRRQAEHCYFEARKYEHGQKVSGTAWSGWSVRVLTDRREYSVA